VQGWLRKEAVSVVIETHCAHCGSRILIELDSNGEYKVLNEDSKPIIFIPMVDFDSLDDPSIIDAF